MRIERIVVGELAENCYLFIDECGDCLAVDPGDEAEKIIDVIEGQNLSLKGVLLTHGHFDHIMAVNTLKKKYNCPVIIGEPDEEMLRSDLKSAAAYMGVHVDPIKADTRVNSGDIIDLANFRIKVIATPGHSKGSVTYQCENVLFTGDTLFRSSVGRTDLHGGNAVKLMQSLKKLSDLEGDFEIYPGHGEPTTLSRERRENKWMRSVIE